jgi:hypothetical protein
MVGQRNEKRIPGTAQESFLLNVKTSVLKRFLSETDTFVSYAEKRRVLILKTKTILPIQTSTTLFR